MTFPTLCSILFVFVSFSELVIGDPSSVLTITSVKIAQAECGYFGSWSFDIQKTKKSSQINGKIPVTQELPPTMTVALIMYLNGPSSEPLVYNMTVCDALSDKVVGQSFVKSGIPKASFPNECPFTPGTWSIEKWDPPAHAIPPGVADGPISGLILFGDEGEEPCITLNIEGQLSHAVPGFGR